METKLKIYPYATSPRELKRCPLCGSNVDWYLVGSKFTRAQKIVVKCPFCKVNRSDVMLNGNLAGHDLEWLMNIALEKWNNRKGECE